MIVCMGAFFGHIQLYPTGMSIDDYPCQSLSSQWSLSLRLFDVHPWQLLLSSCSPHHGHCCCRYSDGAVAIMVVSRSLWSSSCFLMLTKEEGEGVCHDSDVGTDYFSFHYLSLPPLLPIRLAPCAEFELSLVYYCSLTHSVR